jgi:glycosyltransferase involved in cell wall biosynthesis
MVGVDWQRKGGDIALETLERLIGLGIPAELIVVGCEPPPGHDHECLTVVGRLKKNSAEHRRTLMRYFLCSDFLLLPTRSDTFGHVFCEAGALGLPSITTSVGGVGEVVRDGENGYALPFAATGADYAELIAAIWRDKDRYHGLSLGSRRAFDQRLNWDAWGSGVKEAVRQRITGSER